MAEPTAAEVEREVRTLMASDIASGLPYTGDLRDPIQIASGLYLGISNHGQTSPWHVLNLSDTCYRAGVHGRRYAYGKIKDEPGASVFKAYKRFKKFINLALKEGGLLIHCSAALNRSPAVVILVLMESFHMSLHDAYTKVRTLRGCVVVSNSTFRTELCKFALTNNCVTQPFVSEVHEIVFKVPELDATQSQRMKDNLDGLDGLDEAGRELFARVILNLRAHTVIELKRVLCEVLSADQREVVQYVQTRAKFFDPTTNVQPGHVLKPIDSSAIVMESILKWTNPQQDMDLDFPEVPAAGMIEVAADASVAQIEALFPPQPPQPPQPKMARLEGGGNGRVAAGPVLAERVVRAANAYGTWSRENRGPSMLYGQWGGLTVNPVRPMQYHGSTGRRSSRVGPGSYASLGHGGGLFG